MSYNTLRSMYAHDLERMLDDGEINDVEANEMMEDWEEGYGDYMYDQWKDEQLEKEWANE